MNKPKLAYIAVPAERARDMPRGTLYRVPGVISTETLYFALVTR